jgi:glutamyl-tRNA synthetase/glutamyl-Q tRNA(Asp) synthetase
MVVSEGRAVDKQSRAVVTRFAPAPTGYLHLGHVVNALHVWDMARQHHGRVLLRIEDHDRQRSRPEFEAAILEDLYWLGFKADSPLVRQSERESIYRAALTRLVNAGLVYGCRCTRSELLTADGPPSLAGVSAELPPSQLLRRTAGALAEAGRRGRLSTELYYPGTCRDRGIPLTDGVGWRLRIDPGAEPFEDGRCGWQSQDPSAQCGDLLLRDRLGNWTYQFAVTVDDFDQGVTDVIRGTDLLESTGRQIRLARLLGRPSPARFWHHPLVMKSATEKLSKSDGDSGVRDLRAAGWSAEDVLSRARELVGGFQENLPRRT